MSFPAEYPGRCDYCDERIHVGEMIHRTADRYYRHDICPDLIEKRAPICDRCFIEKPCACDDEAAS